jgi:iron complex transport system substrate-binding protein
MTMRRAVGLLGVLLVVAIAGCSKSAAPPKKKDAAERIVSLSPSTTEAAFAIGAGDKLVGRSRYCDYPPEVLKLPQVGGYVDPSLEAILALRPDLVTGARGPSGAAITQRLEDRGVATFFPETETFAGIDAMIVGLGARTGREARAKEVVAEIDARVKAIEAATAPLPRVRVLMVFGLEPLVVAGPGGFPDEMIRRAGGTNAVTEGGGYPTMGVERVISLDPDLVVNAAMAESPGKDRIAADKPGWSAVRAVANGRVLRLTDESVLRPGPRIADGLAVLARAIHPEVKLP